ncbi:eukaryotic translation initiation factor 2 subunit 3 [Batrachochytrium salamandrivorans]|nr:eukaryotic translation initiation factor 2 subunit 3 [Batrachochytrium salamandrivorans]
MSRPGCYRSHKSDKDEGFVCERSGCKGKMRLMRHVSFVDCPGHDILMATMLNGAAVMDAALFRSQTDCHSFFDVNKPGSEVVDLKGGVAGGSILRGVLKIGDEIEVRPGVGTLIDPTICRSDRLVGQVLGSLLGVKSEDKNSPVQKLAKNEVLMFNIGSTSTGGRVISVKAD